MNAFATVNRGPVHLGTSAPRNFPGATGQGFRHQPRSTPTETATPSRLSVPAPSGYAGGGTQARTPYTATSMAHGMIAHSIVHSETPHLAPPSMPMRTGLDSTTSSMGTNRFPPWGAAVHSAATTMATVSDLHMGMPLAPAHFAAPHSIRRPHADPRPRARVMPPVAQAPALGAGGLDICFVMDCTSSMAPWIEAAKTTVKDMIAALPSDVPNKRMAFVGYRDFSDGPAQVQRFTEDADSVVRFIDAQDAIGGLDIPEDIAGGLAAALGLDWKAETRTVVLVSDAPCHGQKYHNEMDDYSDGDPTGLSMVRLMQAFRFSHIDFTLVQLTSKTDKMQNMLKVIYETAAGPENIRKYELRDLRDIIEEAGGETAISGNPGAYSGMLSAAITPTVQASIGSTRARATMSAMPIRNAMIEAPLAAASAPPFRGGARTVEVY